MTVESVTRLKFRSKICHSEDAEVALACCGATVMAQADYSGNKASEQPLGSMACYLYADLSNYQYHFGVFDVHDTV